MTFSSLFVRIKVALSHKRVGTMGGMYGNVGYGKNIFVMRYARKMVQLSMLRHQMWEENHKLFNGIEPSITKVLANFHIWDRPKDPHPEDMIEPIIENGHEYGRPIPEELKLPNIDYMTIDRFLNLEGEAGIQYLLLIDEPYAWGLEARRSGTDIALEMTKKSLQSRKTGKRDASGRTSGSDIFYLTQLPSSMDKRLKFLARFIYLALPPDDYGFHYLYMGKVYRAHHVDMDFAKREIFPFYDTYEKITPLFSQEFMESSGTIQDGRNQDEDLMLRAIQQVTNDVCMVTKDGIKLWKSLVSDDVWNSELERGGKVITIPQKGK